MQEVSYQPFGEAARKTGATPGTTNYENEQWNGGDLLAAFGVVNLGARVYDPVIGRFLSRDPILQAKNPYAFAGNDPVNSSDRSGMLDNCGGSGGPFDPGPVTTCDETGGVIFTGSTQVPNNYGIGGLNEPPIELPGEIIDVTGTCGFACWPKNIFATMGRWGDPRFGNPQGVPAAAPVGPAIVPPAKKTQITLVSAIRSVPPIGKERLLPRVWAVTSASVESGFIIATRTFSWKPTAHRPGGILINQFFTASALMTGMERAG